MHPEGEFWMEKNSILTLDSLRCISSVQLLSHVQLVATPWTAARQASLSITNSRSPPKSMSIESVMPSNHLILCRPLLLPSIFPSIRVFSHESALRIRWPKYWSFSFSISPSDEYSGIISFRMDWWDLLAVEGIVKSLLEHHSSKPPQRNNFSEPRLLHLPIHKRALKVNFWRLVSCVWIVIIFGCSLHFFFFQEKFLAPPLPLLNSPSELSKRLPTQIIVLSQEKAMATHSSTLAWKIPWAKEPGRLQSMGSWRVGHDFTFTFHFHALEKEMATHSSVLAWRIPGTGEPGGLLSMRLHRVGHDWSDLAAAAATARLQIKCSSQLLRGVLFFSRP